MDAGIAYGAPLGDFADHRLFEKPDAGDDQLFVVFYMGVIVDEVKSKEEGRLICRDSEFVRIMVPGDKTNIVDKPATPQEIRRFPKQYDQFKQGLKEEDQIVGTRLRDWPIASRGQVEEFRYLGIHTVEQLSELRDDIVSRVPGTRDLQQIAKAWLGRAKTTAEAAKEVAKEKALNSRIDELQAAVKEQANIIEKLRSVERASA